MPLIRLETPPDYAAIAALHIRAFDRLAESHIVALLRQRRAYAPDLSLIALEGEQVIGHAFFSPSTVRMLGENVSAVNLAPLAVDPLWQRQGIGAALIREGHRAAREKGFVLSFLLGHTDYYPRFGYQVGAYGVSSITLPEVSSAFVPLERRALRESDLLALQALWQYEEEAVDFSILPETTLTDWLSPNPMITAEVYEENGDIVGCTRYIQGDPNIRVFLARDHVSARRIATHLSQECGAITLPLHPRSASAGAFETTPMVNRWDAGMALSLQPNPFDEYYARMKAREIPPGRPLWGTAFDVG